MAVAKRSVAAPKRIEGDGPRVYHFRDKPARILKLFPLFETLQESLDAKRRTLGRCVSLGWILFGFLLYAGDDLFHVRFRAAVFPQLFCCTIFLILAYNLRTFVMRRRSGKVLPGIRAGGGVAIALALFLLFPALTLITNLASLKGKVSLQVAPTLAIGAFAFSVFYCLLLLLTLYRSRLRAISPQHFEIHFCREIVEKLLAELAPNAVCSLAFNPFPPAWSEWGVKPSQAAKEFFFDTILDLRLDLGASRNLTLRIIHRRSSKGRRKHKGWKHKIKCKYVFTSPYPLSSGRGVREGLLKTLRQRTNQQLPKNENTWKFREILDSQATNVDISEKMIVASQTFLTLCKMSQEIDAKDLPHPKLILETIRTISETLDSLHPIASA